MQSTSAIWYSTGTVQVQCSFDGEGGNYSSCPFFRHNPSSMHSTSSKHSSLRGHDPKCDLIWGFNQVTEPAGSCQKGVCSHPPPVGAAAPVAAQDVRNILLGTNTCAPAGKQCSTKERFWSSPGQFPDQAKAWWGEHLGHRHRDREEGTYSQDLGRTGLPQVCTDWWCLPSQAAFSFNTQRADNIFSYFPKFPFLGKATVKKRFC